jgi:CRISPR-associated protein Csx17
MIPSTSQYTYQLAGIKDRSMGSYLAGLGLMKVVERHVDEAAQFYWQGSDFYIKTNVPQAELVDRLLEKYHAMVAFSPWNKSCGIEIDKKTGDLKYVGAIGQIMNAESERTKKIRQLLPKIKDLIDEAKISGTNFSYPEKADKIVFIDQCHKYITNSEWTSWANSAVILKKVVNSQQAVSIKPKYPALLGSGGNIGAVDIAENYYSAFCALFDLTTDQPMANAAACLNKAIFNQDSAEVTESKEVKALHFFPNQDYKLDYALSKNNDYAPSGGSSASSVNPALILLATEGLVTFRGMASGGGGDEDTDKYLHQKRDVAKYSLAVATSGASTDLVALDERKSYAEEYFFPLWSEPQTYEKLKENIFTSPLVNEVPFSLRGEIRDGTDFIRAMQEWATEQKITGKFARYAMLPRKGQSNFAVLLEIVNVGENSQRLDLATDLDEYRHHLRIFAKSDHCPALMQGSIYHFDRLFGQFIQGKCLHSDLFLALGKLCAAERRPKTLRYAWIDQLQVESDSPELRLALSIASCGIKKYLFGEEQVFASGSPIDSLIRLQQQWGFVADKDETNNSTPFYGYATAQRIFATFADISAFIYGANFDDRLFESWLWALSLVDFSNDIQQFADPESHRSALGKLPPAYRLGLMHIKTFGRKNSPVWAIAYSGDVKLIAGQLMGAEIYLRGGKSPPLVVADRRIAAALAFPISDYQKSSILKRFFSQEPIDRSTDSPEDLA